MGMTLRNHRAYKRWAPTYDADPNPHTTLEYDEVLKAMSPVDTEEILDAACGTGRYAHAFHLAGAKIIGADFSGAMLKIARQKVPEADFVETDIASLPFPRSCFTKINCGQALKHLQDLKPVMAELSRVLKPQGLLAFSVTHPDMDWTDYELGVEPGFLLSEESDVFHHQLADYRTALEQADLSLIQIVAVTVSEKIEHLLTRRSFEVVRGRPQIAVFRAKATG